MENKVIVIGGGPAGLSAAIYLARAGLEPLIFAGSPPGGQLTITSEVENYPGFESILGPELIQKMRAHAEKFGAKLIDQNVVKVDFSGSPFKVYLAESTKIFSQVNSSPSPPTGGSGSLARLQKRSGKLADSNIHSRKNFVSSATVIITAGAKALWLGVPGEERLRGRGVSACATCDGFFFRDKIVAVVGGGDTAMEEALTLTKFAKKIYIIHRRDSFRASKIMQDRVLNNPKIKVIYNHVVKEIIGEKKVEALKINKIAQLFNGAIDKKPKIIGQSDNETILSVDGVFVAIGHKPDTEIFKGQIELDEKGYVITGERLALELANIKNQKSKIKNTDQKSNIDYTKLINNWRLAINHYRSSTSVPGVFAAGDCVDYQYRQAGTAVGMGIAAALEVERYLVASSK